MRRCSSGTEVIGAFWGERPTMSGQNADSASPRGELGPNELLLIELCHMQAEELNRISDGCGNCLKRSGSTSS